MPAHGPNGEIGAAAPGVAAEASRRGVGILHKKPFTAVPSALEKPRDLLDVMLTPALLVRVITCSSGYFHFSNQTVHNISFILNLAIGGSVLVFVADFPLQSIANGLIGGNGPLAPNPVMEASGRGTGTYPKRLLTVGTPAKERLQPLVDATMVPVLQVVIRNIKVFYSGFE